MLCVELQNEPPMRHHGPSLIGQPREPRRPRAITHDVADIAGELVTIHVYRPREVAADRLLILFPGYERQSERMLRSARRLAREQGLMLIAPELDAARFPRSRYQRAGIRHRPRKDRARSGAERHGDELVGDERAGMGAFVTALIAWARTRMDAPSAPVLLFGHSAGAQMLSRVMAYDQPSGADLVIIANPSSYAAASLIEKAPFGFGSIADIGQREALARAYLASPLVLALGENDTGVDRLDGGPMARRQGRNRLERGFAAFAAAEALARARNWPFRWRLAIVPEAGHCSRAMLRSTVVAEMIAKPLPR
jgi:poly(3-hydroxybutyrate) depolymerase